ncbi:MAG: hypothetical protein L6Q26_05450 [Anaerolineales bacterium]|nr:hypothetical protein [Anaerolineales bacterium]NUQ83755.1 hypothetical protein [Anaerolineales bacterium]
MNAFKKLFGGKGDESQQTPSSAGRKPRLALGLADPHHSARQFIDEASRIADRTVRLEWLGDREVLQTNTVDAAQLVSAIEEALGKAPDDLDLLLAKSGALCCGLQYKTAEEVLDLILSVDAEKFDARQRKDHWEDWGHLFQFPSWSTAATTLHPIMVGHLQNERAVQLVRDGLQIGIAIVRSVRRAEFPEGLSNRMSSKWEPIWSDTPYGSIVAHYVLIMDNPTDPWRGESFLPTFTPEKASPISGYWLLQRLRQVGSCFIILTDGNDVLYNVRYVFPDNVASTLQTIADKTAGQSTERDAAAFRKASQWHMNNFDMSRIR